jgi:glucokinase-like ROK family protein
MKDTADQKLVRKLNNNTIIKVLREQAPASRANLSAITGLNRSTVSSIIDELIDGGWVRETSYQTNKIGRPGLLLEINPQGGFAVGIEIGVDFLLCVVTDFATKVIWRQQVQINPEDGQTTILQKTFDLIAAGIETCEKDHNRLLGIGVAIPGLVDVRNGILKLAPNLKWRDTPLRLILNQQFHTQVYVENDGNAAALGEYYFGAARGTKDFIYIAAGYGLGSGIIVDGKLLRGNKGYASELGHMTYDPNGAPCSCGKQGCYETVIGPRAVIESVKKLISEKGPDKTIIKISKEENNNFNYDAVVNAAMEKDPIAIDALKDVGCKLGLVVSHLVNIFDPKMVILGGALNYAKDFIQPVVEEVVRDNALQLCQEDLEITNSQLGQDSSVLGAIGLVLENLWQIS